MSESLGRASVSVVGRSTTAFVIAIEAELVITVTSSKYELEDETSSLMGSSWYRICKVG